MKYLWFVLALLAIILGLGARYENSQTLKNFGLQAMATDASGGDGRASLSQANAFASQHMSDSIRVILQSAYSRAETQAQAASQPAVSNDQVYAQAQAACSGHTDSITQAKCNQDYLAKHLQPVATPTNVPKPRLSDYTYDIRSPIWTPDLAGIALLAACLFSLVGLVVTLIGRNKR